jgi:hypothetical protein
MPDLDSASQWVQVSVIERGTGRALVTKKSMVRGMNSNLDH